ncbi:MAG: hypothetical protein ACR2H3_10590 [Acidimicrobiales bacterium]
MPVDLPFEAELRGGGRVVIRALRPDDGPAIAAGFERLSEASRFMRFFSAMPRLSPTVIERLVAVDGTDHVTIAALDPDRASDVGTAAGLGIGVARYPGDGDPTVVRAVIDAPPADGVISGSAAYDVLRHLASNGRSPDDDASS